MSEPLAEAPSGSGTIVLVVGEGLEVLLPMAGAPQPPSSCSSQSCQVNDTFLACGCRELAIAQLGANAHSSKAAAFGATRKCFSQCSVKLPPFGGGQGEEGTMTVVMTESVLFCLS